MAVTTTSHSVPQKSQEAISREDSRCEEDQDRFARASRRVVSFDETANRSYDNMEWTAEDCRRRWYTRFDHRQMKDNADGLAKRMIRQQRHNSDPESYHIILMRVYRACVEETIVSTDDHAVHVRWVGGANRCAGLERTILLHERRSFVAVNSSPRYAPFKSTASDRRAVGRGRQARPSVIPRVFLHDAWHRPWKLPCKHDPNRIAILIHCYCYHYYLKLDGASAIFSSVLHTV